ncbi:MAG: hypothetical protein WCK15_14520 [Pirellula sp.]
MDRAIGAAAGFLPPFVRTGLTRDWHAGLSIGSDLNGQLLFPLQEALGYDIAQMWLSIHPGQGG